MVRACQPDSADEPATTSALCSMMAPRRLAAPATATASAPLPRLAPSLVLLLLVLRARGAAALPASAPKFVLHVIVDDLGWGDVSWHNTSSPEVVTPRLHALATQEGTVLDRFYVHQMCTPSRSSFMSGRLPMHVQNGLPNPEDSICGVPFNMTGLGVHMKAAGYQTAWVGKCECRRAGDYEAECERQRPWPTQAPRQRSSSLRTRHLTLNMLALSTRPSARPLARPLARPPARLVRPPIHPPARPLARSPALFQGTLAWRRAATRRAAADSTNP